MLLKGGSDRMDSAFKHPAGILGKRESSNICISSKSKRVGTRSNETSGCKYISATPDVL